MNPRKNDPNQYDPAIERKAKTLGVFTADEMVDYFPSHILHEVIFHLHRMQKEGLLERIYGISRMRTTYHYIGRSPHHDKETVSKEE